MSTAAILTYPDFFKAAVSCAGNHDNSIYNRWWSEQHHGIKEVVEKGDTTFVYKIETNQELASRLKKMLCHVNLIPLNTVKERDFETTGKEASNKFRERLEARGIPATIRRELGDDIDGACGQLRRSAMGKKIKGK